MDSPPPSTPPEPPSEEELRAAYEEQLRRLRVEDVVIQALVSLLNLGGRRSGLAGGEDEKDPEQLRMAIEGARALLPLVEDRLGPEGRQLRDLLAQLQVAYAREAGAGAPAPKEAPGEGPPAGTGGGPGPAEASGRLWVPGQ